MKQLNLLQHALDKLNEATPMHQRNLTIHKYTPDESFYRGILRGHLELIEAYEKRINNLKKHLENT